MMPDATMSWTVEAALYGWIPIVAILFASMPPARAVLASYVLGWLFLPMAQLEVLGFDWSKATAVPLVVFLAVAAFDGARLARFRFQAVDLPVVVLCAAPLFSSLANGLGWYDGVTAVTYQTIAWGLPYVTGRLYFATPEGTKKLAIAVLAGGLLYAPLCLWEIRMSPQLHAIVYGYHQHAWDQTLRSGGFRPMVFLQHGLMLGLWMCAASIAGFALWRSGAVKRVWGLPLAWAVPGLIVVTVLCKSFGAIVLMLLGIAALLAMRHVRTALPMLVLVAIPPAYVVVRAIGGWTGEEMVALTREVSADRASSLDYRIESEERLRAKAAERPVFGWGGWGRSLTRRSTDPYDRNPVTIDSLWILVYGKNGVVGLASLLLVFLVPIVHLWRRCPPQRWAHPLAAAPWGLALVLSLFALDSMVNAMLNPVYVLVAGALAGFAVARAKAPVAARASSPPHDRRRLIGATTR